MKQYPTISKDCRYGPCYMFEKLDGSNIRAEWTRKKGFDKFGSRKVLIGPDSLLGEAIKLIHEQTDSLAPIFEKQRWQKVTCFFEFYGPNSFAGLHEDEPHVVKLIDVDVYKQGLLDVRDFIDLFPDAAKLIHQGNFNKEIESQIRSGEFPGMTFEGVVCKVPSSKKWTPPFMFKVKNQAWISKVKERYGDKAEDFL